MEPGFPHRITADTGAWPLATCTPAAFAGLMQVAAARRGATIPPKLPAA